MNNSLVKTREIRGEPRMRREDVQLHADQSKMLVVNLSRILGEDHVRATYPTLVASYIAYQKDYYAAAVRSAS